ncbi:MAG: PilT/PilU family type 4a pilus ATPase, partial [Candidatus Moranbacteria bacterium]|nr:PilT/PilU family type 4a pilus ATPase [Candidatus Moranbacteria bacterium]
MNINDILDLLIESNGSDIHLIPELPPVLRIDGDLAPVSGVGALSAQDMETLIDPLMTEEQKKAFAEEKEWDFGYQHGDKGRFRINVYYTKGRKAAALRLIPARIKSMMELGLPKAFENLVHKQQGLVLVTGPTGEGKSTSLAALIDQINTERNEHILTIEDPIEFVYKPKKSIISQREINQDTKGWTVALRSALREDPDVVLVGELRDYETIAAAITVAETGHLVMGTLHTATAAQTIDRIVDVFESKDQIRVQLASVLTAIVSQRLVQTVEGLLTPVFEILIATPAVKNCIREGKTFMIDNIMQTSSDMGMVALDYSLAKLVKAGTITEELAMS